MGQCIEVCRTSSAAHPWSFLPRRLKTGMISFALGTQSVCSFEIEAAAVNGKPVVRGIDLVFTAAPVLLPIIPILVVTGTDTALGLAEWATVFLAGTPIVCCFSILVHSQSGITDQVARRKCCALGIAFFEGDKAFPIIDRFHGVVDVFRIVAFIRTPLQGDDLIGCGEDVNGNCGISDIGWRSQLV